MNGGRPPPMQFNMYNRPMESMRGGVIRGRGGFSPRGSFHDPFYRPRLPPNHPNNRFPSPSNMLPPPCFDGPMDNFRRPPPDGPMGLPFGMQPYPGKRPSNEWTSHSRQVRQPITATGTRPGPRAGSRACRGRTL